MKLKIIDRPQEFFAGTKFVDSVFLNTEWQSIYRNQLCSYGIFKGQELLAFFHVIMYRSYSQKFVISPPLAPHCGFTIVQKSSNLYADQTQLKRMLRLVADFFSDKKNADYIDIVFPYEIADTQEFVWKGFRTEPLYSYLISNDCELEMLMRNMSSERRKNIRDAQKKGYQLSFNTKPDVVRRLIEDSLKNTSVNLDLNHLEYILNGHDSWRYWTLVSLNGIDLAATLIVFDQNRAWYVAGGYDHEAADSLAGTWALWHTILESRARKIESFDFNGSSIQSIEKYFRGFGGELRPRFRVVTTNSIIKVLKGIKKQIKFT